MRVALEAIRARVLLHISVESDPVCRRVVEAHFPDVVHYNDAATLDQNCCDEWATKASSAKLVLLGAGPPYHNGIEAGMADSRSPLHVLVQPVVSMLRSSFNWCPVRFLHESFFTMDVSDREAHTRSSQVLPYRACAGGLSLCDAKDTTGLIGGSVPKKAWYFIHRHLQIRLLTAIFASNALRILCTLLKKGGSSILIPLISHLSTSHKRHAPAAPQPQIFIVAVKQNKNAGKTIVSDFRLFNTWIATACGARRKLDLPMRVSESAFWAFPWITLTTA